MFIRNGNDQRWYKFDDGEVTECKMDDEDEMKNQCFGGEYMGEVSRYDLFGNITIRSKLNHVISVCNLIPTRNYSRWKKKIENKFSSKKTILWL